MSYTGNSEILQYSNDTSSVWQMLILEHSNPPSQTATMLYIAQKN
jgi:hypothetical protein